MNDRQAPPAQSLFQAQAGAIATTRDDFEKQKAIRIDNVLRDLNEQLKDVAQTRATYARFGWEYAWLPNYLMHLRIAEHRLIEIETPALRRRTETAEVGR